MKLIAAFALAVLPLAGHAACNLKAADVAHAGKGCAHAWMDENLRLNDVQTVGTHNSYHRYLSPKLYQMVLKANPVAIGIDYDHPGLTEELNDGVRGLEIDVAYDPEGGLLAHPLGAKLVGEPPPEGFEAVMAKPGFKVLHIPDIDFRATCQPYVACLKEIRAWSKAHPNHAPILIMSNAEDGKSPLPGGVRLAPFDEAAFDAWDAEIRSVFAPGEVITPDLVQGTYPTLREAALAGNWPTLKDARGKVMFVLDESGAKLAAYRGGRRSLGGRMMFVNAGGKADRDQPYAAFMTLNEAHTETADIKAMVKAGFLVRTRADADTREARINDTRRRELAFQSGAQVVSTDYRHPETRFGNDYRVRLPGDAVAVCNPVRTASHCDGATVEP